LAGLVGILRVLHSKYRTSRAGDRLNARRSRAESKPEQSGFEGLLTIARNALRSMDQQSSAICEHSIAVAEQTLSNAFDFSHKVLRMKDPLELAQIQSEFLSGNLRRFGDHTREFGQRMRQGAHDIAEATQEGMAESRRRSVGT
jgi:hypothetical protein